MITIKVAGTEKSRGIPPGRCLQAAWKEQKFLEVGQYVCDGSLAEYIILEIAVTTVGTGTSATGTSASSSADTAATAAGPSSSSARGAARSSPPEDKNAEKPTRLLYTEDLVRNHSFHSYVDPSKQKTFATFKKVHVLPFEDTFAYNYDHMFQKQILPFLRMRWWGGPGGDGDGKFRKFLSATAGTNSDR